MNEFIRQDDNIILNAGYAEAYIPESLFTDIESDAPKSSVAYMVGTQVHTIGVFNMKIMNSEDDDPAKFKVRTFSYPTAIDTFPSDVVKRTMTLGLDKDEVPDTYRVLKYIRGDIIMSARTVQSNDNCEAFMNMLLQGKIPTTIPYDQLIHIWDRNFKINGLNPGVPSLTLQLIISEMCRDKKDPSLQFRKTAGKGNAKMTNYLAGNMRTVASYTNVMNALTFENMGEMLTTSINITREGKVQDRSPLEKVLTL